MSIYRGRSPIDARLRKLQADLDVAQRFSRVRHSAMHGEHGDIAAEGLFCGLMTAMIYYSEPEHG